jgi:hypothetical protein
MDIIENFHISTGPDKICDPGDPTGNNRQQSPVILSKDNLSGFIKRPITNCNIRDAIIHWFKKTHQSENERYKDQTYWYVDCEDGRGGEESLLQYEGGRDYCRHYRHHKETIYNDCWDQSKCKKVPRKNAVYLYDKGKYIEMKDGYYYIDKYGPIKDQSHIRRGWYPNPNYRPHDLNDDILKLNTSLNSGPEYSDNILEDFKKGIINTYGHIKDWDVSQVTDMSGIFEGITFTRDDNMSRWDTSNVINMSGMFKNSKNLDIENVDLSTRTVRNPFGTSRRTYWDVSNVTNMNYMFSGIDYNPKINNWNVEKVEYFSFMFNNAINFNRDISDWYPKSAVNMKKMFYNADSFNYDLSRWSREKFETKMVEYNLILDLGKEAEEKDSSDLIKRSVLDMEDIDINLYNDRLEKIVELINDIKNNSGAYEIYHTDTPMVGQQTKPEEPAHIINEVDKTRITIVLIFNVMEFYHSEEQTDKRDREQWKSFKEEIEAGDYDSFIKDKTKNIINSRHPEILNYLVEESLKPFETTYGMALFTESRPKERYGEIFNNNFKNSCRFLGSSKVPYNGKYDRNIYHDPVVDTLYDYPVCDCRDEPPPEGQCSCDHKESKLDDCGVCMGYGCMDENGNTTFCGDLPGEYCNCEGDTLDCSLECGGTKILDECGVCDGLGCRDQNEKTIECSDEIGLTCDCDGNIIDDCGECGGLGCKDTNGLSVECGEQPGEICDCFGNTYDCSMECGGPLVFDKCGVCDGLGCKDTDGSTVECGVESGDICNCEGDTIDLCGVCNGTNECVGCDGIIDSDLRNNNCGTCGERDRFSKLGEKCNNYPDKWFIMNSSRCTDQNFGYNLINGNVRKSLNPRNPLYKQYEKIIGCDHQQYYYISEDEELLDSQTEIMDESSIKFSKKEMTPNPSDKADDSIIKFSKQEMTPNPIQVKKKKVIDDKKLKVPLFEGQDAEKNNEIKITFHGKLEDLDEENKELLINDLRRELLSRNPNIKIINDRLTSGSIQYEADILYDGEDSDIDDLTNSIKEEPIRFQLNNGLELESSNSENTNLNQPTPTTEPEKNDKLFTIDVIIVICLFVLILFLNIFF